MSFHGGNWYHSVQTEPELYVIFWGPWWQTPSGQHVSGQTMNLLNSLRGSAYADILTQYYQVTEQGQREYITNNWRVQGSWVDSSDPRPLGINYEESKSLHPIQAIIANAVTPELLAHHITPTPNTTVLVFPQTGKPGSSTNFTSEESDCQGAHTSAYMTEADETLVSVAYVVSGETEYAATCNINGETRAASHEWAEAISDVFPDLGWADAKEQEVGDECSSLTETFITYSLPSSRPAKAAINPLWDKATESCASASSPFTNQPQTGAPQPVPSTGPPAISLLRPRIKALL